MCQHKQNQLLVKKINAPPKNQSQQLKAAKNRCMYCSKKGTVCEKIKGV